MTPTMAIETLCLRCRRAEHCKFKCIEYETLVDLVGKVSEVRAHMVSTASTLRTLDMENRLAQCKMDRVNKLLDETRIPK